MHYAETIYDEMMNGTQTLLSILLSVILGLGCSRLARYRGRNPTHWFIGGVFFGIFALALLFFLPARKQKPAVNPQPARPKLNLLFPEHDGKLWYFLDEEKGQHGPMSFDALTRSYGEGKVKKASYVWNEAMEEWQEFYRVIQNET